MSATLRRDEPPPIFGGLEASGGFHRDSRLGRLLHPGKVSLREVSGADSLHISVGEGNRLSVHVDRVCPVAVDRSGRRRYAPLRVAAHLVADVAMGLVRLVTGRHDLGRCELVCEVVETAEGEAGVTVRSEPAAGAVAVDVRVDQALPVPDDPAPPGSIQLEARVAGRLDEARLRAAVSEALVGARVSLESRSIRPPEAPPLRLRLARHPAGDVVVLNVDPAMADGGGALCLLRSVARAYAGTPDPIPGADPLAARERRPAGRLALVEGLRNLVFSPARVVRDGVAGGQGYGLHHVRLGPAADDALARVDPAAVDGVLVAALHLAVADWNAEHRVGTGRIGVLVAAGGDPSRCARVSTAARHRLCTAAALATVTAQTHRRSNRLRLVGDRPLDSAMVANLGAVDPPSFGPDAGATTELWFSPPARMPRGVAVGAVSVAGRLHLAFRYRRVQFDAAAARRFGAYYVGALERAGLAAGRGSSRS